MDHLNKIFSKHIDDGKFPGVQWQINIKDKIYSGKVGYNNIETKEPVLDNTIYRIWSMTKPVVAVAALQLLEQNKIKLDDLVTKYLPEFSNLKVLKKENTSIDDVEDLKIHINTYLFGFNFLGLPFQPTLFGFTFSDATKLVYSSYERWLS